LQATAREILKRFKKSYVDMDKSDDLDAFVIADRLRWGRDVKHPFQYDEKLFSLRFLTRYRYHVVHQLAGEKAYCLSVLYLKASEYANEDKQPFSNLFGAASRAVIQDFASLEEVAAMPSEKAAEWWSSREEFPERFILAAFIDKSITEFDSRVPDVK
jgi:hypothetical protein